VAPEAYSEHPNWPADYGAWYVSQVLDVLTARPEVWSKTVLLVNFDEEGGFFDHMVPPTPAATAAQGGSTVPVVDEIYAGDANNPAGPYGLGMRVPMLAISPWSKGGWVDSQLFDHTSIIKFLEARFANGNTDLVESNITPWRRAVTGDLTSCFDFATPNASVPALPSTDDYLPPDRERHPDYPVQPPAHDHLPRQEPGLRLARALPYALHAGAQVLEPQRAAKIAFRNAGAATAVFLVHSALAKDAPRTYTVEPGRRLAGTWHAAADQRFDLAVRSSNGFLREFRGSVAADAARLEIDIAYDEDGNGITLSVTNAGSRGEDVHIRDRYRHTTAMRHVAAGSAERLHVDLARSFGWYDVVVTAPRDAALHVRAAGHVENGRPGVSDPAMAGLPRE